MTVRIGVGSDIEALMRMGRQFADDSEYAQWFRPEQDDLVRLVDTCLSQPWARVWVLEADGPEVVGMLAGMVVPHPIARRVTIATELAIWIDPAFRHGSGFPRLVGAYVEWARAKGATLAQFIAPNPKVAKLYEHMGMTLAEQTYVYRLEGAN